MDSELSVAVKSAKPKFGGRKTVTIKPDDLIRAEPLQPEKSSALLIRPAVPKVDLYAWTTANRDFLQRALWRHGAILFRDFALLGVAQFQQFISAASLALMHYGERSSPRSQISEHVYTSTDYPADQSIFMHNENSYAAEWPMKIFFHCVLAATSGGETPIADCRRVYERISPVTRKRFEEKKVLYLRNFGEGFGLPWQTVFQTDDPAAVSEQCSRNGIDASWREGGRLRTRSVRAAIRSHPVTGERVWFNHAAFFNVTTLGQPVREALLSEFAEEELPSQTFYGDGTPIESEVLDEVRAAYVEEKLLFDWQEGDVLMLDNMLTAHGREPFVGGRKIVVGMAEPFNGKVLAQE
jgi:alpha-ketoglutarate-dependent taurine dioxygenase